MISRRGRTPGDAGSPRRWRLVKAGRDAVPALSRRWGIRFRLARLRRNLWALGVLLGVGVVATGLWIVYGTGVMGVERIRVTGTRIVTADQVRQAAGVALETPLARVDLDEVAARVEELAPVRQVVVERDWPHTLVVRVTERTAVAVVPTAGGYWLLDATGVAYHRVSHPPENLPVIRVLHPRPQDATTQGALRVLAALTPTLREQLVALVAESPTRISLELTEGRTVIWGDASRSEQKAEVATVLLEQPGTIYDVSSPDIVTTR